MSPAFSHCFLKRLSAFSKLSSGSTITLVTRNSPLSHVPEALTVYHAPPQAATRCPCADGVAWTSGQGPALDQAEPQSPRPLWAATMRHFSPQMGSRMIFRAGLEGRPSRDHAEPQS